MKNISASLALVSILSATILFIAYCIEPVKANTDLRGPGYAGSTTCQSCHQQVYDHYKNTAHSKATSEANHQNIKASFEPGHNIYSYDVNTKLEMQKRDSCYFFQVYNYGKQTEEYRIDLIFGWKNAQTYMYAKNDHTYELPLSYYHSVNKWGTSPGFPTVQPYFARMVGRDCYECHSSYLDEKTTSVISSQEKFDVKKMILGIDCERCHGPAMQHVTYHLDNPADKKAKYIVLVNKLSRAQKIDACAICHSGNDRAKIESRFYFRMGDTLDKFFMRKHYSENESLDVHGNQHGLLSQSKCFTRSANMTCMTCHNAHQDANADLSVYSQTCIKCHKETHVAECPKKAGIGEAIGKNCIDCHMPKQASGAISFRLQDSSKFSSYVLRSHRIMIYKDSMMKNLH